MWFMVAGQKMLQFGQSVLETGLHCTGADLLKRENKKTHYLQAGWGGEGRAREES